MRVALDVHVRVNAGHLSSLEVTGLDTDAVLAPDAPAIITSPEGTTYLPTASSETPGSVVLRFADRRQAPGHGDYTATLSYDTHQAFESAETLAGERKRVRWTLPSWEVGLPDVHIVVLAPRGTAPAQNLARASYGDESSAQESSAGTELTFRRVEVPRTQAWEIAFDVPGSALPAPAAKAPLQAVQGEHASAPSPDRPWAWLAGLGLGLLALAKRRLTQSVCARANFRATPLIALGSQKVRALLVLTSCATGMHLLQLAPVGSALLSSLGIACALDRSLLRLPLPPASTFRTASAADLQRSRWRRIADHFAADAWLDATTLAGASSLALLHATWLSLGSHSVGRDLLLGVALCATPLFFTATQKQRPLSASAMLSWLSRVRAGTPVPAVSTELLVGVAPDGRVLDARLRFSPSSVFAGTGKLELVIADALLYGRPRRALALLALCQHESPADAMLAQALPASAALVSCDGKHVARVCVTQNPGEDAQNLVQWLTPARAAPAQISRAA